MALCAATALGGCEMPFEMPETDWFGSSREIPVSEGAVEGGAPTQLALDDGSAAVATQGTSQGASRAATHTGPQASQARLQAGSQQGGASRAPASQATPGTSSGTSSGTNSGTTSGTASGVALAPAEGVPLLASREAAFVGGPTSRAPTALEPTALTPTTTTTTAAGSPQTGGSTGRFKVQLASYLSMDAVEQEWARLRAAYPELLADKTLSVRESDLGADGIVYGVRTGSFPDRLGAETFCDKMVARGEDCLVVGGPGTSTGGSAPESPTEDTPQRVVSREQTKGLADVRKEALFEQFLQWQRRRDYGIEDGTDGDNSALFEQFLQWREERSE